MDIRNKLTTDPFISTTDERIFELIGSREAPSFSRFVSLAEVEIDPGNTSPPHFHEGFEEIYYILDGEGQLEVDGYMRNVRTGDAILIRPTEVHQIRNRTNDVLRFLAVCGPPFDAADLQSAEMPVIEESDARS